MHVGRARCSPALRFVLRSALLSAIGSVLVAGATAGPADAQPAQAAGGGTVNSIPAGTASGPVYLSLGDSVPMWDGEHSFPDMVTAFYRKDVPHLQLVNMACSGETTQSMMSLSMCAPGGSQLRNAVDFLMRHRGDMALITMDIGGNDVVQCVGAPDPSGCFTDNLAIMKGNLTYILDALRLAAGPNVPIVGMNVFDPLLGDWLAPGAGRAEAKLGISSIPLLNQAMDMDYGVAPAPVADVQDAFNSGDLSHFVQSRWGRVPVAVERACTLLDITCRRGQQEGFGDDPDVAGARVIARAFEAAIGTLQPPS